MVGVSSPKHASSGPYRPSRDPQILVLVGIVIAVVALWLFGVMSPATLVGGDSEPVFPFSDQSGEDPIEVSVNASVIDPGDAVAVTVTIGNKQISDAPVTIGGDAYRTDEDGTVVVRLEDPGSYSVRAQTPGGERSSSTSVRVRRFEAELRLSVPATAETGEGVPVRVTHENGTPASARVQAGGETVRTDEDGVATVTFETAGTVTVRATKAETERYRFVAAERDVEVERRPVRLAVSTNASTPTVDDPMTIGVTRVDTGEAVNATVVLAHAADGNETLVTGPDGQVTASFDRAGSVEIRVSADRTEAVRFVAGETTVDVQRIPVELSVSVTPQTVPEGDRATVVVRRNDTGDRVPATVTLYGTAYETGVDGAVSFPFYSPGEVTVEAAKNATARERYVVDTTSFVVQGPEIVLESLSVPENASAGGSMEVTATLSNVGNEPMSGDAVVTVGDVRTRIPTSVAVGETTTVTWTVDTPSETGEHRVRIEYEEVDVTRNVTLSAESTQQSPGRPRAVSASTRDVCPDTVRLTRRVPRSVAVVLGAWS